MISGKYVHTFAEASHAIPIGMPLNSDYPFKMPKIVAIWKGPVSGYFVEVEGTGGERATFRIKTRPALHRFKGSDGQIYQRSISQEYGFIIQASTFERLTGSRGGTKFEMQPFRDENTPAAGFSDKLI